MTGTNLVAVSGRGRGRDGNKAGRGQPSITANTQVEAQVEAQVDTDIDVTNEEDLAANLSNMNVSDFDAAVEAAVANAAREKSTETSTESSSAAEAATKDSNSVTETTEAADSDSSTENANDKPADQPSNEDASADTDANREKLKNLAAAFLSGKKGKPKKGCQDGNCEQVKHEDGTTTCACHGHQHEAVQNIPTDAPSDIGKALAAAPAISCLIIGDSGVGKTSFLNKHMTGHYNKPHDPTRSVGVAQLLFATNFGWIKVHTIDTVGKDHPKLGGLEESYYPHIQSVIIMFDVTNPKSYKNATKKWVRDVLQELPQGAEIPKILVGNKVDLTKERRVKKNQVAFQDPTKNQYYFDLSVDLNVNIEIPFLALLIRITGIRDLQFVNAPHLVPKEPRFPTGPPAAAAAPPAAAAAAGDGATAP